ncbi:hypothetical protein MKW92_021406 [Papaver armeniacum]|nr:hypothetical protein MKW92_021406 [Papaver armeniacum]
MLNLQAAAGDSNGEPLHTGISSISSSSLPREIQEKKLLVLDLDETLVHTVVHTGPFVVDGTCDLSFTIRDRTYCVKLRPYVHKFLERASQLFNLVIFTASSKFYADTVIDFLDPQRKFIGGRYYLDSVVFHVDGKVKDLTIFGVDLAKIILVDNRPTNFRWQKDNGVPIESWYSDQQDEELSTLLPFLERLACADDVRPIIAQRFSHCTEIHSSQDPTTREVVAHNKRPREAPSILVGKRRKICARKSCIIRKEKQELWGLVSIAPPSCISV